MGEVFLAQQVEAIRRVVALKVIKPGNEHVLEYTQNFVDKEWDKLLKLEESTS